MLSDIKLGKSSISIRNYSLKTNSFSYSIKMMENRSVQVTLNPINILQDYKKRGYITINDTGTRAIATLPIVLKNIIRERHIKEVSPVMGGDGSIIFCLDHLYNIPERYMRALELGPIISGMRIKSKKPRFRKYSLIIPSEILPKTTPKIFSAKIIDINKELEQINIILFDKEIEGEDYFNLILNKNQQQYESHGFLRKTKNRQLGNLIGRIYNLEFKEFKNNIITMELKNNV